MKKSIEQKLFVHIDRPDGIHLVGELEFDDEAPGGFFAKFRYSTTWLEDPRSFPLDPINLPLAIGTSWIETENKYLRLGVLFDAGPDMWGRRVVQSKSNGADESERQLLLMGRGNGVGALLFATSDDLKKSDLPKFDSLPTIEHDLLRVHQAAHNVFNKTPLPENLQGLLDGSWSMGGARAKAVMRDAIDRIWIAKFSEPGDSFDRQRAEWANLEMARDIGMDVPECHVYDTSLGSVFLIERFDRSKNLDRIHFASGISLVSAVPQDKRLTSPVDQANFSYAKLASIVSQVSPDPASERAQLYARMVLNICVHNTDDHLKNIAFIEHSTGDAPGASHHMKLSPVFDVVTQSSAKHFLHIGRLGRVGSIENALSECRRFRLTEKGALAIVKQVTDVVSRRQEYYEKAGLLPHDCDVLNAIIEPVCPSESDPSTLRAKRPKEH